MTDTTDRLLEALTLIRDCKRAPGEAYLQDRVEWMIEVARAAIAKAEGNAQRKPEG